MLPVFGLCVGWPDPARPAAIKPHLPKVAVIHRERYSAGTELLAVMQYNTTIQRFYQEQQMRVEGDWAEHSARRVAGPASLSGRHILRDVLRQLGFTLR